ncbi:probable Ufm1-specific protease 2 [Stomoxys calcitrans]|uniref:Probable Ufm1-specific protease 2 n=1 Tax=Stomoxys calcitrans TaxID=35570 RepID=A0A1I8Q7X1_STOCA|nr:probable Ufm1-specific protease 2 [Stomoxys calcitrans]
MLPKLKISALLLKRLEQVKQQCSGCLFGVFYGEGTLLLLGFNVESTIGQLNYEQIQHKFPAEVDLCGLVKFGDCSDAEAHLSEVFKDVDITDNPILLHCELGTLVGLKASFLMHGKLEHVPYEVMDEDQLYRDFCFTRLKCSWTIYTEDNALSVRREMHALRKTISGGSIAFNVQPTKVFITNGGAQGTPYSGHKGTINNDSYITEVISSVQAAVHFGQDNKENVAEKKSKKTSQSDIKLSNIYGALGCEFDVINIEVLRSKTREFSDADNTTNTLPSMSMCLKPAEKRFAVPVELEPMAILNKNIKVSRLYDILIESICRSLRLCEQSISESLEESQSNKLRVPKVYNFYPKEFGHFISCCYLDNISDDDASMQNKRKRLHRHSGLPVTRPYFRRTNVCIFRNEISTQEPLLNTHVGLKASGVSEGKQYLVQGYYHYYHYLQQQMQDNGWGCAYRSLQTICSWFLLQGYTERAVPTHLEIQQHLVKIGDKPLSFKGSSQWIGSTEVGMCLQGFLNVESKIQHVTSGGDLSTIASDLAMHFQTQGTPIMIGGGVLAHTIIGIDYNVQTGQIKFLILDPHYTGEDDLQIIQSKGWCGWKGMDFWDKKSYYNLCLPQRPIMF